LFLSVTPSRDDGLFYSRDGISFPIRHSIQAMRNASREMEPSFMRGEKQPAVYIMANRYRGTIYIGVTSNLYHRVAGHKASAFAGFTAEYGLKTLVWYEHHPDMPSAILRETRLKVWKRAWKIKLIEAFNPD
jgi:putative endonuclease